MLHYQVDEPDYLAEIHYPATIRQIRENALPELYAAAYLSKPARLSQAGAHERNLVLQEACLALYEEQPLQAQTQAAAGTDAGIEYLIRVRDVDSLAIIMAGFADFQILEAQKALAYLARRDDSRLRLQAGLRPDNLVFLHSEVRPTISMQDFSMPPAACLFGETPGEHYYGCLLRSGHALAVIDAIFAQLNALEEHIEAWHKHALFSRAVYSKPLHYTRTLLEGIVQNAQEADICLKLHTNIEVFCEKRGIDPPAFEHYIGISAATGASTTIGGGS